MAQPPVLFSGAPFPTEAPNLLFHIIILGVSSLQFILSDRKLSDSLFLPKDSHFLKSYYNGSLSTLF